MKDNPSLEEEIVLELLGIYRQYHGPGLKKSVLNNGHERVRPFSLRFSSRPQTACFHAENGRKTAVVNRKLRK